MCGKYSLAKLVNFVYGCITCGNCYHFSSKMVTIFACNTIVETLQTLLLTLFQHSDTKFCEFTIILCFLREFPFLP